MGGREERGRERGGEAMCGRNRGEREGGREERGREKGGEAMCGRSREKGRGEVGKQLSYLIHVYTCIYRILARAKVAQLGESNPRQTR